MCRKFEYRKTNELNKFYVSILINVQTPQILPQTQKLKMSYVRFWCEDSDFWDHAYLYLLCLHSKSEKVKYILSVKL